jgi:hypothetical protein
MAMRHRRLLVTSCAIALCACASAGPAPQQQQPQQQQPSLSGSAVPPTTAGDQADVIAVMERLFDAMRVQDTLAIRLLAHPELRIFVPGQQNGEPTLRVSTLAEFIRGIAASTVRLDETAVDPEVRIDHNLATIWTYYDFYRGDQFSHCGFDAFHLARGSDGWLITGLAYTIRQDGCRPQAR